MNLTHSPLPSTQYSSKPSTQENLVYQDKQVLLKHLVDLKASLIAWSGFPTHAQYKAAMEQAYELIKREHLSHWISDQRQLKTLSPENQQWVNQVFIPRVLSTTRVNKVAIIVGKDVFTQAAMVKIKERLEQARLPIRYFEDMAGVEAWFKEI